MALTPLRWTAAVVAGALLVLAYSFSPQDVQRIPPDPRGVLNARERKLTRLVLHNTDRLRASLVIDSLRGSLRSTRTDSLRVLIASGIPAAAHAAFHQATQRALRAIGGTALPIDVAFVIDTAQVVHGRTRRAHSTAGEYVLPLGPNDRCLTVIRLRRLEPHRGAGDYIRLAESLDGHRMLGPCAFIGAFGRPGPRVAEWLNEGAWGYALVAGWSRRAPKWQPSWWATGGGRESWALRNYMGLKGYGCAAGDLDSCETAAVTPASPGRATALARIWGGRILSSSLSEDWWYRLNLGPQQSNFLSDLVLMIGPDHFRRFWTSPETVPEAFRSATGRSIGSSTHEWMRWQYGGYAIRGTRVPAQTAGLALLFIGAGTAGAVVAARRRRVR